MFELIVTIIFVISLGAILLILARKIPALLTLSNNGSIGIRNHRLVTKIEAKIKSIDEFFEKQILLHKLMSWAKVITLKIETKIDKVLHNIRKKSQKDKK